MGLKKTLLFILTIILLLFNVFVIGINIYQEYNTPYTITWKNYDGKVIYEEKLYRGSLPEYKGSEPIKENDNIADYNFSGWFPKLEKVKEDTTYIATYEVEMKKFGIVSSFESGFYDKEFNLSLISTDNSTIYYTLDSTNPTIESNVYSGEILIEDNSSDSNIYSSIDNISTLDVYIPEELVDKCVVLKAIAVDEEGNVSDMITKTFFVGYNKKIGYDNLPIISMVVNPSDLYDYEDGIYVTGKKYDEGLKEGYPETYPANYQEKGIEWERVSDFTYFESDKSFSFEQKIGIRIHGGWSRAFNQKSFNLYAREEYSGKDTFIKPFFDTSTLKTCMLRSGGYRDTFKTKIRDGMNQDLSKNELFSTQDNCPCILFLNGEYWGIYYLQERFTDNYVEEHYKIDDDNVIIVKNDILDEGIDSDMLLYEEMINFFKNNNFKSNDNYLKVHNYIDINEFASYMATELYIGNSDWPGNNVCMFRSRTVSNKTYEDGKWHFMFYDTDDCAGILDYKCGYDTNPFINNTHWKYGPLDERSTLGLMLSKLLENEEFKTLFINTLDRIAKENYSIENVNRYLDESINKLAIPMTNFYHRFVSNDKSYNSTYFKNNIEIIRTFYTYRYSYIKEYLKEI